MNFLEKTTRCSTFKEILKKFKKQIDIFTLPAGEAQKAGFTSPEEMNELVKELRKEMWEERYANND